MITTEGSKGANYVALTSTGDKSTFAHLSACERWPIIVGQAADEVRKSADGTEGAKKQEGYGIADKIAALRLDILNNKKLRFGILPRLTLKFAGHLGDQARIFRSTMKSWPFTVKLLGKMRHGYSRNAISIGSYNPYFGNRQNGRIMTSSKGKRIQPLRSLKQRFRS